MKLSHYFADLHIHIGNDLYGNPVKISASKNLTLTNILKSASRQKGIDIVGVIDCHVPNVLYEIEQMIDQGKAQEMQDGGISFEDVTLILGSEIEVFDDHCQSPIHTLVYLPTLQAMYQLSDHLKESMTNYTLSSQRYYGSAKTLQLKIKELGGLFIPAHVFTPFKSLYGKGVRESLTEVFEPSLIDGIELGLSSDTLMAENIKELQPYEFVTNSDAHSLAKIGREYQVFQLEQPTFQEIKKALKQKENRRIVRNYGMNPSLGKYSETVCYHCRMKRSSGIDVCSNCRSDKILLGVQERIAQLSTKEFCKRRRPDYIYQVPLDFLPGLGPRTLEKLLDTFETEMNIIHHATLEELESVLKPSIAKMIIHMRTNELKLEAGGGGKYGQIKK